MSPGPFLPPQPRPSHHQDVPRGGQPISTRVTVWRCFMGTRRETLACGRLEPVRWKATDTSVKENKTLTSPCPSPHPVSAEACGAGGLSYRVVEKKLDWTGALHLCESLNGTLATIKTPYEQAYLTLLINNLRRPAWIGLYNYGGRSFTWLGEEEGLYSNWKDGEPSQSAGCGHMTTTGEWVMSQCDAKLGAACVRLETSRNNCYAFDLQHLRLQQDARSACKKVGAELLSILDETENEFVWEHIQSYAEQAHGAWLGISVKGREQHWAVETGLLQEPHTRSHLQTASQCRNIPCYIGRRALAHPDRCHGYGPGPGGADRECDLPVPAQDSGLAGSYEGARYSRTNSSSAEQAEKNILVSDMELNEQQDEE
ncbi:hypothetical protein WMY93_003416 [Mugilogobius chulae]|uniref:C-type lectin domain-containing protein n=1 Tax=Mugilogobius chulae TaxID=88201 RepID=A0AAW0PXE2_9GOBI